MSDSEHLLSDSSSEDCSLTKEEQEKLLRKEEARLRKKFFRKELKKQAKEEEEEEERKQARLAKSKAKRQQQQQTRKRITGGLDSEDDNDDDDKMEQVMAEIDVSSVGKGEKRKRADTRAATHNQDFTDPDDSMVGATQEFVDDSIDQFAELEKEEKEERQKQTERLYTRMKAINEMKRQGELPADQADKFLNEVFLELQKGGGGGKRKKEPVCEVVTGKKKTSSAAIDEFSVVQEGPKRPKANDGCAVVKVGCNNDNDDGEEDDGLEVVDMTTGTNDVAKVGQVIPIFKLNNIWTVGIETIPCTNGRYKGTFDVMAIRRIPKDEKSKPYSFNIPLKILRPFTVVLEKIVESAPSERQSVNPESLLSITPDEEGVRDLSHIMSQIYPKKKYLVDGLTVKVDTHNYKSGAVNNSYLALIMIKKLKDPITTKTAEGEKKKNHLDLQLPVHLTPVLCAVARHYCNLLYPSGSTSQ
jgi:hypothetical protein